MHMLGAEDEQRLCSRLGLSTLEMLRSQNYLCSVPTPLGNLSILGPIGRQALGLAAYYKSPPEAAVSQWLQRRVKEGLEQQGWRFQNKVTRNQLHFWDNTGQSVFVLARYRGYTSKSLRHILEARHAQLMAEHSQLAVVTNTPERYQKLRAHYPACLRLLIYLNNSV